MSDYTQLTFFAPKDALSTGNPSKLIKGAEVDPELSAISTAIASKFDSTDIASNAEAAALSSDTKLMTPAKILHSLTAGTFTTATGLVSNLTAEAVLDQASDFLLVYDVSAGALRKTTPAAIASAVGTVPTSRLLTAGAGLSGGGDLSADRTFSLDTASARNVDHSAVTLTASTGLTGGGDISASRSFAVDRSGTDGNQVGYLDIPAGAPGTGNYTLVIGDRGKTLTHTSGAGSGDVYTIPANASVAFPVGSAVTFVNLDSNSISIAITTDTLTLAGSTTTGTRTLSQNGVATALKVTSTSWLISGPGLS